MQMNPAIDEIDATFQFKHDELQGMTTALIVLVDGLNSCGAPLTQLAYASGK